MKNYMKKIIIGFLSFVFLFIGQNAFASVTWNTASNDCQTVAVANVDTGAGWGNPCWPGTNINASPGDTINVRVYYHNTGTSTATNTHVILNAQTGSSTNHSFTGQITSSQNNLSFGPVYINMSPAQTLTYDSIIWYTGNTSQTVTPLLNGQNGQEILSSPGLYIGDITAGWPSQGSVVVSFVVGSTPLPSCTVSSFTANPNSITSGSSSTLSWATNNCTSVSISPTVGSVNVNGTFSVYPTSTTTYTLTAQGNNGSSVTQSQTVTVNQVQNCSISSFTVNGSTSTTIQSGSPANFAWATNNCTSATISPTLGNVNVPSGSQTIYPTTSGTYTLTATGSNGSYVAPQSVYVTVNQIVQNCAINNFTASPNSITSGGSSTLTWSTSNCTSAVISNLNYNVPVSGTQVIYPTYTTTYVLTAYGTNGGQQTQSQTVTVNQLQSCAINNFTASPNSITSGGSSTLTWSTSNCTSAVISNLNYNVPVSGTQVIYPTYTTTYVLTAYGTNGGQQTQSQTVTVNQLQSCAISSFMANGSTSTTIQSGGAVNISWSTTNCTSGSISPTIGSISMPSGSQTVYPTYSGTYTLTVNGTNGSYVAPQSVYVNVNQVQNNCYISNFTANGSSSTTIQSGGAVNLVWNTSGGCSVTVTGPNFNSSNASGSQTIYPTYSGTYTLVAYGSGSGTQTQSVYVSVNNYQYNNCAISYFTASPTSINYGGLSMLSWSTSNCNSVSISNLGSVNSYGSQNIYPTYTTTYTLTAYGTNGGQQSQAITVTVNNYVPTPVPVYNTCAVTTVATNITRNSVTLNGLISNSNSYSSNTYFEYGTTINLGSQTSPRSVNGSTSFSETLTGLSSNTIYFYRLVSNCGNGTSQGSVEIFQTSGTQTTTTTIIRQGTTVIGTESPIMLKIEDRYQSFKVGDSVDYTVTYKNISNRTLTHPVLQVILPKGITFLNSSRGTYSSDTYTLTVSLEDLVPNVEGTVYLQGRVDSLNSGNAQIVTTALLVYTARNGAQENAMAYVLNNPDSNNSSLGALALFGNIFGMGIIAWMILLVLILLAILLFRKIYRKQ